MRGLAKDGNIRIIMQKNGISGTEDLKIVAKQLYYNWITLLHAPLRESDSEEKTNLQVKLNTERQLMM